MKDGNYSMLDRSIDTCPDPEVLAAYVDRVLPDDERHSVAEHLSGCPDCYEVFSETVRLLDQEVEATVLPGPWRRAAKVILPVAAALALAFGAWAVLGWLSSPWRALGGDGSARKAVASLEADRLQDDRLVELVRDHGWPVFRGGASGEASPDGFFERVDPRTSFQLGVLSVDLALALEAGDAAAAGDALDALDRLPEARLGAAEPFLEYVLGSDDGALRMDQQLAAGEAAEVLGERWDEVEAALLGLVDAPGYRLGRWAEAGRLAAAAGDLRYLDRMAHRGALAALDALTVPAPAAEPVAQALERIRDRSRDGVGADDLPQLEESFGEVVSLGGGGTGRSLEG